jgi:hypothetical protein
VSTVINYYRFCCKIRIADEYASEVPGGEFLAVEDGRASERREQFPGRLTEFSDWFAESPALLAHIRALQSGRSADVRARLVETDAAMIYANRTKQDLYALAKRGRLTRYRRTLGASYRTMWDVLELDSVRRDTSS